MSCIFLSDGVVATWFVGPHCTMFVESTLYFANHDIVQPIRGAKNWIKITFWCAFFFVVEYVLLHV
jgi:hypothetical protein